MKVAGICLIALLAMPAPWMQASHAAAGAADPSKIELEMIRQKDIYQSRGDSTPSGYTVDRSLLHYTDALPGEFGLLLTQLGPQDRWLDIGAGQGQAILDYFTPGYEWSKIEAKGRQGRKARAVAMSIEDRRTPRWKESAAALEADQIKYVHNKQLRDYSLDELGKFRVITDVVGGFSYTDNLTVFMEKVLAFLELKGSFYTVLQDVHSDDGTNKPYYPNASYLTEIADADGAEVKVCAWLKSISCVEVTCELKTGWRPPIEAYRVQKVCEDTRVPPLTPVSYQAGTPPERRFRLAR